MAVKGLTIPLSRWLLVLVCLCRCVGLLRSLLLNWYLGSKKPREILTLLCCITLSSSRKTNARSRRSKMDFWRRCRGVYTKVNIPSTHHNPYLPHYIICHLPLVFLSPTSPLLFYLASLSLSSLSFSICLFLPACFLFACVLVCLLVTVAQDNTKF